MKLIFISGPSGSGKTTLSNLIKVKVKNSFVLSTDNYYKTGIISKLLSKVVEGYFDRSISFNYKLFKKDFNFILKNGNSIYWRSYNFEKKSINTIFKEIKNIALLLIYVLNFVSTFFLFFIIFRLMLNTLQLLVSLHKY